MPGAEQVLRSATLQGAGQPSYDGAVKLIELVAERRKGEIRVALFPDGQLGTEQESPEGVQFGTIDMFMGSTGAVGRFLPKLEAFAHPYVWRDTDHMLSVVRGEIGEELTEELRASTGIRSLDMGCLFGQRHLSTRATPVRTPADMADLKIRVQPTEIHHATVEAMGGNPTPMDFKLSPELQEVLLSATRDAGDYQNELLAQKEAERLELIKSKGMQVVEPAVEAFRAATADVHHLIRVRPALHALGPTNETAWMAASPVSARASISSILRAVGMT